MIFHLAFGRLVFSDTTIQHRMPLITRLHHSCHQLLKSLKCLSRVLKVSWSQTSEEHFPILNQDREFTSFVLEVTLDHIYMLPALHLCKLGWLRWSVLNELRKASESVRCLLTSINFLERDGLYTETYCWDRWCVRVHDSPVCG